MTYITPRYTSGMLSTVPIPSSCVHATFSWPTFCRVICLSGLKRCASYVRLYISQSSGLGFSSISFVTGVNFDTCAEGIAPQHRKRAATTRAIAASIGTSVWSWQSEYDD